MTLRDKCLEAYSDGAPAEMVNKNCTKLLNYITEVSGQVSSFDVRLYTWEWNAMLAPFQGYLGNNTAQSDVYKALHVENSTKTKKWTAWNTDVYQALVEEITFDYTQWYDWMQAH